MYYDRRVPPELLDLLLPDAALGWLLAWLRANPAEDGHRAQAVALAVMGPKAKGWMVSTQLSVLYHAGLLRRRVVCRGHAAGGIYAYRALSMELP